MKADSIKKNLTLNPFYIKCDFLPLSLNNSKAIFRGRMIKTKKARDFEKIFTSILLNEFKHLRNYKFYTENLHLVLIVGSPKFITKKGSKSKTTGDIDGFVKHVTDQVFKTLLPQLDDSQIIRLSVELAVAKNNQFHFVLTETDPMISLG